MFAHAKRSAKYLASLLNLTQISRTITRLQPQQKPTKVDKCPALAPAKLRCQFIFFSIE